MTQNPEDVNGVNIGKADDKKQGFLSLTSHKDVDIVVDFDF